MELALGRLIVLEWSAVSRGIRHHVVLAFDAVPVATLRVDAGMMALLANGGISLAEAEAGGLTIRGDRDLGVRLLELLSLR